MCAAEGSETDDRLAFWRFPPAGVLKHSQSWNHKFMACTTVSLPLMRTITHLTHVSQSRFGTLE